MRFAVGSLAQKRWKLSSSTSQLKEFKFISFTLFKKCQDHLIFLAQWGFTLPLHLHDQGLTWNLSIQFSLTPSLCQKTAWVGWVWLNIPFFRHYSQKKTCVTTKLAKFFIWSIQCLVQSLTDLFWIFDWKSIQALKKYRKMPECSLLDPGFLHKAAN